LNSFLLPAVTLWQRELVRFRRQKRRVPGVIELEDVLVKQTGAQIE
jgi:hypothetical protein